MDPKRAPRKNLVGSPKTRTQWKLPTWSVDSGEPETSDGWPGRTSIKPQHRMPELCLVAPERPENHADLSPLTAELPHVEEEENAEIGVARHATARWKKSHLRPLVTAPVEDQERSKPASSLLTACESRQHLSPLSAVQGNENSSSLSPATGISREMHFQLFRESLWKRGSRDFGNSDEADAFVKPVQLVRRGGMTQSPEKDGTEASRLGKRLAVRVVVHSKNRSPIELKREFDLDTLRATVSETCPSPRSPGFSREALLASLTPGKSPETPCIAHIPHQRRKSSIATPGTEPIRSPLRERRHSSGHVAVPMHIYYARAHLPVLASIMMSEQVRRRDTIDLPVPYPRAWTETVAFVYTGEEELFTEHVKQNIRHLGGKV